jgi:hypothetical protein
MVKIDHKLADGPDWVLHSNPPLNSMEQLPLSIRQPFPFLLIVLGEKVMLLQILSHLASDIYSLATLAA